MTSELIGTLEGASLAAPLVDVAIEEMTPEYLNNFFCVVPGGFYRSPTIQNVFKAGETFGDAYRRTSTASGVLSAAELEGYTEKKLQMTPNSFFQAVDDAVASCGISDAEVINLQRAIGAARSDFRVRYQFLTQLHNLLFPVYLTLRISGFSHRDLVG